MSKESEAVFWKYIEKRNQMVGWMTGGTVLGSVVSFFVGFAMGFFGVFGAHAHGQSGFDRPQQSMLLPWALMWVVGYSLGQIASRGFDCSANPSCTPYPTGPFGGGGGGGW